MSEGRPSPGTRLRALVTSPGTIVTVLSIVLALLVSGVLVALVDDDTVAAFGRSPLSAVGAGLQAAGQAYAALFQGAFGSSRALSETLVATTPLILTGLAVGVPFRAGLFNIGGEGQVIAGGIAAGWVGFAATLPGGLHAAAAVVAGLLAGAAFGALPGVLKATTGAHEVITTIMFNNIAGPVLLAVLATQTFQQPGRGESISKPIADSARLASPGGRELRVDIGILIALAAAWAVWWLLERSTVGFQIKAVGANATAAITAGMSAARITVLTMSVAGAAAGLAGAGLVLGAGGQGAITSAFSGGVGFDGITVALLGRGRAKGTVAAAVLFGALRAGGLRMQARTGTPVDLIVVTQALIILLVAAPLAIQQLFRLRNVHGSGAQVAKGWGA